jgi:uncharacterized protein DUF3375
VTRATIVSDFALARNVYTRPEVRFLSGKQHGVFILAVFRSAFTRQQPAMLTDDFHQLVDDALAVLKDQGETGLPDSTGRTLCLGWMEDEWLDKELAEDGRPVYRPSLAAQTVLDWLTSQTRRRLVSAPRVTQVFELVAQLASLADPDRDALIDHHEELAKIHAAEAQRLRAGSDLPSASDDELIQHAALVGDAMDEIPSDFRRVGEQFIAAQRSIREALLTRDESAGRVIATVTSAARRITAETPEGRAFMGVAELIRDEATMATLRDNVTRIMNSPVADMFSESERVMFANIASLFVSNVDIVLQGPRALSRIIAGRLAAHVESSTAHTGIGDLIRAARTALLAHSGPIPDGALPTLGPLRVPGSTLRLDDPAPAEQPQPLADAPQSTGQPLSPEYLKRWGGPHGEQVAQHITQLLRTGRSAVTLAEAWQAAPADLHRSVELLAYFNDPMHVAIGTRDTDIITIDEDGKLRDFRVPRITFTLQADQDDEP